MSVIFRILRVIRYKDVSVEGVRTSFHHIVMNWKLIVGSLITETGDSRQNSGCGIYQRWLKESWIRSQVCLYLCLLSELIWLSFQMLSFLIKWSHWLQLLYTYPNVKSGSWVYSKLCLYKIYLLRLWPLLSNSCNSCFGGGVVFFKSFHYFIPGYFISQKCEVMPYCLEVSCIIPLEHSFCLICFSEFHKDLNQKIICGKTAFMLYHI